VEPAVTRLDVDAALAGIFDANAKLDRIVSDVAAIRRMLEGDDEEEEEEGH
jgi:hypothetical protein